MAIFEIPLQANSQVIEISLGGIGYRLKVVWCDPNQTWVIDILDSSNNPVAQGIPMVTGLDLLGQFKYLGIQGKLVAQTDHNALVVPTFTNLGNESHLYLIA